MYSIYFLISWANVQLMFIMQTCLGPSIHLIRMLLVVVSFSVFFFLNQIPWLCNSICLEAIWELGCPYKAWSFWENPWWTFCSSLSNRFVTLPQNKMNQQQNISHLPGIFFLACLLLVPASSLEAKFQCELVNLASDLNWSGIGFPPVNIFVADVFLAL